MRDRARTIITNWRAIFYEFHKETSWALVIVPRLHTTQCQQRSGETLHANTHARCRVHRAKIHRGDSSFSNASQDPVRSLKSVRWASRWVPWHIKKNRGFSKYIEEKQSLRQSRPNRNFKIHTILKRVLICLFRRQNLVTQVDEIVCQFSKMKGNKYCIMNFWFLCFVYCNRNPLLYFLLPRRESVVLVEIEPSFMRKPELCRRLSRRRSLQQIFRTKGYQKEAMWQFQFSTFMRGWWKYFNFQRLCGSDMKISIF